MRNFRLDAAPTFRPKEAPEVNLERARKLAQSAWETADRLARQGDFPAALAWMGRAHRIAPADQTILFSLAWIHLRAGDAARSAALFSDLASRHPTRECLSGLIAAHLACGDKDAALATAQRALSHTAADAALATLASRVVEACGLPGWCGLDENFSLLSDRPLKELTLLAGGRPVRLRGVKNHLPPPARHEEAIEVRVAGEALLGSPLRAKHVFRLEGFVEFSRGGAAGWAWHPGAPGRVPALTFACADGTVLARKSATRLAENVEMVTPLARPRRVFHRMADDGPVHVLGPDGRGLLGSPVNAKPPPPPAANPRRRRLSPKIPADVIIPVYRGFATTLACLESVRQTVAPTTRLWVVNDASPEPALVAALERLSAEGAIRLIDAGDGRRNRGFPAAVNAGMRAATGRHVVLLNSDTLVPPHWLDILREAACSAPDIGTATPISNDASILSYPREAGKNPVPDLPATIHLAALAAKANRGRLVEIPTAHGFCMFIRRDCLDQTGFFDEATFAQGYGEENDFSERATALGWRHVAVPEVFVAHQGGVSFGEARQALLRRNLRILQQRHPGYESRVAAWIEADPLSPARRRLDAARWKAASAAPGFLLITHGAGGGTALIVKERGAAIRQAGFRPVVLRAVDGVCEVGDGDGATPNLRFSLPREFSALRRLLAATRPAAAEVHHLLGHHHSVVDLCAALGIPYDIWVHDYAWFCPRLSFITGEGRFCGEPDTDQCDVCVARWGQEIEEEISPAALRARSAADLRGARAVIVPSQDVARRVARHVPGLAPVVRPWEPPPDHPARENLRHRRDVRRVAVVGAIGPEKGFEVLLDCARDAAERRLNLEFVVVGYTSRDEVLLETKRVFITGPFEPSEAAALIRAQAADLAFLPSIWPETWCYALSDAWAAGLPAAVFDIGTPPARVRAAGRGWVLPLGLPAARVNDVLLSLPVQITASNRSPPAPTRLPHMPVQ